MSGPHQSAFDSPPPTSNFVTVRMPSKCPSAKTSGHRSRTAQICTRVGWLWSAANRQTGTPGRRIRLARRSCTCSRVRWISSFKIVMTSGLSNYEAAQPSSCRAELGIGGSCAVPTPCCRSRMAPERRIGLCDRVHLVRAIYTELNTPSAGDSVSARCSSLSEGGSTALYGHSTK
jgi:hypothetical protein